MEGREQLPQQDHRQQQHRQRTIRRRRRLALSCRECRRRKVKCDHDTPSCANCLRNKTQCIYKAFSDDAPPYIRRPGLGRPGDAVDPGSAAPRPTAASSSPPSRAVHAHTIASTPQTDNANGSNVVSRHSNSVDINRPWSTALGAAAASRDDSAAANPEASDGPGDLPQSMSARRPGRQEPTLSDLLDRIQKLESSTPRTEAGRSPVVHEVAGAEPVARRPPAGSQQEWQAVLNKPRDWGRSRWISKAPEFGTMIRCYSEIMCKKSQDASFQAPETTRLITEAADFLQKCKSRAKSIKVSRPTRSPPSTEAGSATYSREMADVLAKLYFTSIESAHRILHAPTFWAEYEKYWERPESASPDLRHKVNLVIGIGSSLYDYGDAAASQRRTELLHQWIYSAQTWLSGPLEKDRLDISGLQVYCLTILARQIFSIGGDTVWMSMGSLVHRAMQVGLHLDPKHLPAMPALQAELRRRLWATILEFVVQSSLDAWMPPRIALSEFDTEPPSNINDEDMDESTTAVQPRPRDTFTSTSLQLALLESLPTRLRIVELLNGMHSELRYERVLSLTSELTSALQNQATLFQSPGNGSTPFHRNYLDYLTRRFIIPLHYPFSHQARVNPLFHRSVKLSLDAGLALVSPEPDDGMFTRLTTISGGMFREGFRSATTAISLELLTHVATQRSDGSLHRVHHYRGFLKQAVRDLIGVSEQRIRMGETNVKSHMFLSMILAEVEAVEDGKPVEVEVARAARDSLRFCEGLLAARTDINADMASVSPAGDDGTGLGAWGMGGGQGGFEFEGLAVDFDWEIFATN